ncbi:MAG: glycosyltransferase [Pseudomonadota bacterium]
MRGNGTKLGITTHKPPARLLDLTRSLRRAGRTPTGVDRVELAYLDHLIADEVPLFALVRSAAGYLVLDTAGLRAVQSKLHGATPPGAMDVLSALFGKRRRAVRQLESDLRRHAVGRSLPGRLSALLRRHLPGGTAYVNVGHVGLSAPALRAIKTGLGGPVAVMIHDTIPLDYPAYQRAGSVERFRDRLAATGAVADLILCNSNATKDCLHRHLGDPPDILVAPLGIVPATPDPGAVPPGLIPDRPYFVTVGTIEPRKGHDLLLDVWDDMAATRVPADMPGLIICGARGWNNEAVFARLDALPETGPIREVADLSDGAIAALLQGSRGLLFPSRAEGYGLPPLEAAHLQVPVVLQDLHVYRETLEDIPIYAKETDRYLWRNIVERLMAAKTDKTEAESTLRFMAPRWLDHFDVVCKRL